MVRVLFYASIISLVISAALLFLPLYGTIILAAVLLVAFILILILKRKNKFNHAFMIFICFCFCVYGIFHIINLNNVTQLGGKTAIVEGYVTEDAESYDTYCAYILNTTRVEVDGTTNNVPQNLKIRITKSGDFTFSSFVNIKAKVKFENINSDYKFYSYSQSIYLSCRSAEVISCTPMQHKPPHYPAYVISKEINKMLYSNMGYEEAALSSAVLLGDETGLTTSFYNNSKVTGVTHMLVVSGTHISIITLGLIKVLEKIKFPKRMRPFLMLFVVYMIMAICGFSESVVRAGFTYIVYFVGDIFFKKSDGLNALGTATVILLFESPFLAYNVGYLLSYAATYAVIALTGPVYKLITKIYIPGVIGRIYYGAAFILAQTLAATFATLPISMFAFGYVSVISPITNLLLANAVNGILSCSIFASMLAAVPILNIFSFAFFFALTYLSKFCYFIINLFGNLENTLLAIEPIHILAWCLIALAFAGYIFSNKIKDFLKVHKATVISCISLFLVGCSIFVYTYFKPLNHTKISFVYVGNAICAIVSHKETALLIGVGESSTDHVRITDRIFKLGKRGVDLVLIPTTTKDYCGGYETLENINTKAIVANSYGTYTPALSVYNNVTYFDNHTVGKVGEICYSVNINSTVITTPDISIEFNNESGLNEFSNADILVTLNYVPEEYNKNVIVCGNELQPNDNLKNVHYVYRDTIVNIGE